MTALLIGLGNVDRGDDAVGIEVARRVAALDRAGVDVVETSDPTALLDLWTDAERVVVVDAMVSHRAPGVVESFDVADVDLPAGDWAGGGSHALGLGAAVRLSRALGRMPRHLVVVGVEIGAVEPTATMSPAVAAATDVAVRTALAALADGDD